MNYTSPKQLKIYENDLFPSFQKDFLDRQSETIPVEQIRTDEDINISNFINHELGFACPPLIPKDYDQRKSEMSLRPPTLSDKNKTSKFSLEEDNSDKKPLTNSETTPKNLLTKKKKQKKVKLELEVGFHNKRKIDFSDKHSE